MTTASLSQAAEADDSLLRAIASKNLIGFQAALTAGASAQATDSIGDTALHRAVTYWGDADVIRKLLMLGANVNATNPTGETPLLRSLQYVHYSGEADKVEQVVQLLIAGGARVGLTDTKGNSPVAAAVKLGRIPLIKALIDSDGRLPPDSLLQALALGTNVPLIQFLLEHPKDIDLELRDASGRTAAHLAAQSEQRMFLLRWLILHGANLQVLDDHGSTLLAEAAFGDNIPGMTLLVDKKLKLDAVDKDGLNITHLAALGARQQVLQWLVERGADLQARDRWGRRPLDIAIDSHRYAFAAEADQRALIKLLGGDSSDYSRGRFRDHPLHLAIQAGNIGEVNRLLSAGANANVKDEAGHTPLNRAIQLASGGPATSDQIWFGRQLLPLLLKHGADTTIRMPVSMESYDELALHSRYADELNRLKAIYGQRPRR